MRYLSLFSGAGGGDLGCQYLLGWQCLGYVEWDAYCCQILAQRIQDGIFSDAPVFHCDIREWLARGYAASYTGLVDVITAGFPCQPFSNAGKRAGADDERNMWPATIECIRVVRPKYCLLENVPGLLTSGYFGTILGDLAESGYDVRWRILSAAEMGAPHKRDRLWLVAYAPQAISQWQWSVQSRPQNRLTNISWWQSEPNVGRVVDGLAFRTNRIGAIGNGQVPDVVRAAWWLLSDGIT